MISNTYASTILGYICGVSGSVLSFPDTIYIGLCASEPNALNGAISGEPSVKGYERKLVAGSSATTQYFGVATNTDGSTKDGVIMNTKEIQFKTIREAAGVMNYFFLSKSKTGPAIMWGELKGDITTTGIEANTVPVFFYDSDNKTGELLISLDVPLTEETTTEETTTE